MAWKNEDEVRNAIAFAVRHAMAVVGVAGLRKTSMFPSSERVIVEMKRAA